jgi:hypothetical protein
MNGIASCAFNAYATVRDDFSLAASEDYVSHDKSA